MVSRSEQFTQDATGTLNGAISAVATSLVINSATGWPTSGDFRVRIGELEIVLVTAVSGTTWTIERAADGTTALSADSGAGVVGVLTGGAVERFLRDNRPWNYPAPYRIQDASGNPLTASDFTLYGSGFSAAITDAANGGIRIAKNDQGASDNVSIAGRPALSTPYSVVMAFTHELYGVSGQVGPHAGGCFYYTVGQDIVIAAIAPCVNNGYRVMSHGSLTGGSTLLRANEPFPTSQPQWMKLEDDGTNLKYYYAPTGGPAWEEFHTMLRGAAPFASPPDVVGFSLNNFQGYAAQGTQSITLVAWYES